MLTLILVLGAFIGGIVFEHYYFHTIEEKVVEIYDKLKGMF